VVKSAAADQSDDRLKAWLSAAASPDSKVLAALTAVPFDFRTTNKKKFCEGVVKNEGAFSAWARCFRKASDLLLADFQNGRELGVPSPVETAPKEFSAFAQRVKVKGTWADATFAGDGFTVRFRYLVTKDGRMAALFVDWGFYE
jgi:hypothetical protein